MEPIKIIDTDTDKEDQIQAETSPKFPKTIYRNARTKELDKIHPDFPSSRLELRDCSDAGRAILPLFTGPASVIGFYFGIREMDIPSWTKLDIEKGLNTGILIREDYNGEPILFPNRFE